MKRYKIIDYMKQPDERKKVAHLLQNSNFRRNSFVRYSNISSNMKIKRNRILLVIFAFLVLIVGLYSVFS